METMKLLLTIIIMGSLVIAAPAQRQNNRRVGALVNTNKPAVYISFLRSAKIESLETNDRKQYLWFRITNNSRWAIWLDMSGVPKEYGDAELSCVLHSGRLCEPRFSYAN